MLLKLLTVKYLGLEIAFITIKPNQSELTAINKFLSSTTTIKLMRFIG